VGLSVRMGRGGITVALTDQSTTETQRDHVRAGLRLNSRVELKVEWESSGRTLEAPGYTVDISPKGCLAIVARAFPLGQKMRVTNPMTGMSTEALLVWRGHEGRNGWELGLQIESDGRDFWGVEFY
jgi:PilZ domain